MASEARDKPKSLCASDSRERAEDLHARRRLVLADDDPVILEMVARLLRSRYEIVGSASDGAALVDAVTEHCPDVAVVDISMPKLNGIEAARVISNSADQKVKVIMLSVHDDPAYVEAAFEAGAHGYVLKQAAEQELIPAIETVFADGSYVSAGLR